MLHLLVRFWVKRSKAAHRDPGQEVRTPDSSFINLPQQCDRIFEAGFEHVGGGLCDEFLVDEVLSQTAGFVDFGLEYRMDLRPFPKNSCHCAFATTAFQTESYRNLS
jgi:hypothetical protein